MDNQDITPSWATKDATIPLLLSGVVSVVLCAILCAVLYLSRDFINNDIAPRLGLGEPTPTSTPLPVSCPAVPGQWKIKMEDHFRNNQFEWPIGDGSHTDIRDGQLVVELTPEEPVLINPVPGSNASLNDFYLTTRMRQTGGSEFNEYGLMFRANGYDIYFFRINNNGTAILQKWTASKSWEEPIYKYSIPIKSGGMNELTILNSGDRAIFCVNGHVAFEQDDIGTIFGNFGVAASMGQSEQKTSYRFDDFKLYAPKSTNLSTCPPVSANWRMTLNDNFNTNKYDWPVGKNSDFFADTESQILDGRLQINILPHLSVYFPQTPRINSTQQDFYVITHARKVKGPDNAKYGLTFRIKGDQTLFFAIQEPATALLSGRDAERFWHKSLFNEDAVNTNAGGSNELVVIGRGSHYTFCINRSVLREMDNLDYQPGEFGLAVDMLGKDDEEAIFEFDDLIVYSPVE